MKAGKNEMKKMKLHVLHTGTVIVDEALPFHRDTDGFLDWTGLFRSKKHRIALPVSVYLIEHPKGLILIDTGWHTDNRKHQMKNLKFQWIANKADLLDGQAVHEQLARLGFQPEDLDMVLLSHLHCDHADGLRHVKNAKKIMVSQEEWDSANKDKIKYLHHEWKGVDVQTFQLKESGHGPFGKSFDVFGDGTVEFIWIPGHSDGLCATKLTNTETGDYILLTSDAGYAAESWKENLTPGVVNNREQAQASLDWVRQTVNDPHCLLALANHDPEVKPQVIEV